MARIEMSDIFTLDDIDFTYTAIIDTEDGRGDRLIDCQMVDSDIDSGEIDWENVDRIAFNKALEAYQNSHNTIKGD